MICVKFNTIGSLLVLLFFLFLSHMHALPTAAHRFVQTNQLTNDKSIAYCFQFKNQNYRKNHFIWFIYINCRRRKRVGWRKQNRSSLTRGRYFISNSFFLCFDWHLFVCFFNFAFYSSLANVIVLKYRYYNLFKHFNLLNRRDENIALVIIPPHSKKSYIPIKTRSNLINRIHKSHFWPKKKRSFFAYGSRVTHLLVYADHCQHHFKQPNFHKMKSSITMIQFFLLSSKIDVFRAIEQHPFCWRACIVIPSEFTA